MRSGLPLFKKSYFFRCLFLMFSLLSATLMRSQSITLVTPNGGEVWEANSTQDIIWTGNGISGSIYIEYSLNNGQSWNYLYWGWSDNNGGTQSWDIPFIQSANAKIRVTYWNNQNVVDVSDNVFQIVMPSFALIAPNGGETYYVGQVKDIQWHTTNSTSLRLQYSVDNGGTWLNISNNVPANLTSYQWTVPNNPSYFCKVKVTDVDNNTLTDESNNCFIIAPEPTLTVTYPNGGEVFQVGDTVDIAWTGTDLNGGIGIDFSEDNGANWSYLGFVWGDPTGGTYEWIIPNIITANALISVKFWDLQTVSDTSDNTFEITLPSFGIIAPNGGEALYPNQSYNIKWTASGTSLINIDYSTDNGASWVNIAQNVDATLGSYSWTVPNTPSVQCLVKMTDAANTAHSDVSNQFFTINPLPVISITAPNGGETIEAGATYAITWTGSNIAGNIYLEYSVNSGSSWNYVGWGWSNSNGGSHDWTVPSNVSSLCLVRATYWDYQNAKDTSDAVFSIVLPAFAVNAPNGNEILYPGNTCNIQWVATNASLINIDLTIDNGDVWQNLASNVDATLGTFSWTIPNTPSQQCLIRITDVQNPLHTDNSNGVFTISPIPVIQLNYPNGGEQFAVGDTCVIAWSGTSLNGGVYIEASYNNGTTWNFLSWEWSNANGGTYSWIIPNNITNHALVRVKFWDYPAAIDVSDAAFSILPPDFAVITPNGGENYYPFQQVQLEWYANNIPLINIDYSTDNGNTWNNIESSYDASLGNYIWTVPDEPSSQCQIKITDVADINHFVVSNNFNINELPVIQILSPNGGEVVAGGATINVVWSGSQITSGVNIEYSTDNGLNWTYIGSVQGSLQGGNYNWTVPYLSSNTVKVRVSMWTPASVYDISDNYFTIQIPSFALLQPNGGQSYYPMQQTDIQWNAASSTYIKITYTHDGGQTWLPVADSVPAVLGTYTWTVPNTSSANCFVRIQDVDNPALVAESATAFTILQMPAIHLVTPNGGQVYTGGQSVNIQWTGTNIEGNIYIEYSTNGGTTWEYLSWAWGNINGGTYSWTVPYISSTSVMVRVKFWTVPTVFDQSDAYFTVQLPVFVLIKPNGSESFFPGNTEDIEWNAANSNKLRIEYSIDNGTNWMVIQDSMLASAGIYSWLIPNTPSSQCRVKITDVDNPSTFDVSNFAFTINPVPTLAISAPNGGEVLTAGTTYNVAWTGSDINSFLYLEYSFDAGASWQYMGWGYGNATGGSFAWQVPFYESQTVKVRGKIWNMPNITDESDTTFAIVLPPFALITPNGYANYYPGNTLSIQWIAENSTLLNIEYSTNSGLNWSPVANNVDAALNVFDWVIPNTPSNTCLVKITDVNDTTLFDVSDNAFTIKVLPTIHMVSPNGGEIWTAGDTTSIVWTGSNLNGNVVLEFTTNNWITSTYINTFFGLSNGGSFNTTVPFVHTTTGLVRARFLEASSVTDQSDSLFSIVYPPFSLISPNGYELLYPTNIYEIKWYAGNVANVKLDYSINNGSSWINIEQSINATSGFYYWTLPNTPSNQCLLRVTDVSDTTHFDVSNHTFTIKVKPTIQLTSPVGGEVLVSGTYHTISWTGTNLVNAVRIFYSTDLGNTWEYIDEIWSQLNGASFQWFVPYTPTNNALVRVVFAQAPAIYSQSASVFTIQNPAISVIYPNANEVFYPYNEEIIRWVCVDSTLVNLKYTTDNGNTWNLIASDVPASWGEYTWVVPDTPSSQCKIKVTNQNNPAFSDETDTIFTINSLPPLVVVSPNGGEVLTAGTVYPVEWAGQYLSQPVIVEYTDDDWATSHLINWKYGNLTGDTIGWVVPFVPTTTAKVKAYYYPAPAAHDYSDGYFSIVNPPFALISPIGGEAYFPTNEAFIQWVATNTTLIKIEYSTDNGNTWHLIASQVDASLGAYSWIVPNTPSTLCKVRITDEFNALNTSQSVFKFTIYPYPSLQIVSPNGGEQLVAGNTYPIVWLGTNLIGGVSIEYSTDAGITWNFIENFYNMPNGNTYYWQAPFQITNQALIRARFLSIAQMYDESNNLFSIVNPSFALVEPVNPGLSYYPNTQLEIKWIATSTNYIKILFSPDNGQTWTLVQDSVPAASGSYLWTVPNQPSTMCKIRIVDVNDNLIYDTSDFPFTIGFLPNLILVTPNGGESYVEGDSVIIRWLGSYLTGGLYLDYSTDSGTTWINITSKWGNPNGDSYTWIAPAIIARVLVRVSYIDIPAISDQSNATFTICFYPAVYATQSPVVCQPNTVDISAYIADSLNASGSYAYWLDSMATQLLSNPYQVNISGIYYVTKETMFGGCMDTASIEILVGTTPLPPIVATSQHLCSGDSTAIVTATGTHIYWYGDSLLNVLVDTGQTIAASQFYSDTVLYVTQYFYPACPSTPAHIEINYYTTPPPPQAVAPPPYCAGDSVSDIVATGANVNWYDDTLLINPVYQGNVLSLPPLYNDTVFYITQSENNCESLPFVLTVDINPVPPKPTISQSGMDIVSSSSVGNQWFNAQGQMLDTNQYFTPPNDNFYYVVVTINGCVSDTSDIIYYYITGNQLLGAVGKGIFVYPNPFTDALCIYNYLNEQTTYTVEIYNLTSQKLYESILKFDKQTPFYIIKPDIQTKGAYILILRGDKENIIKKIIKQ